MRNSVPTPGIEPAHPESDACTPVARYYNHLDYQGLANFIKVMRSTEQPEGVLSWARGQGWRPFFC